MTELSKLNEMFGESWKTAEEIDWVKIARTMKSDLEFMKENGEFLVPAFVVENPELVSENYEFSDTYLQWIYWYNDNIHRPSPSTEVVDYFNSLIQADSDFEESAVLEAEDDCVGFYGMDQATLYKDRLYFRDGTVLDKDTPWETAKSVLLENVLTGPDQVMELTDEILEELRSQNLTEDEVLTRLKDYREIDECDDDADLEILLYDLAWEMASKELEDNEYEEGDD